MEEQEFLETPKPKIKSNTFLAPPVFDEARLRRRLGDNKSLTSRLSRSTSPINNLPFVKNEKLKIVVWFLLMVLILAFPIFILLFWGSSCAAEKKYYGYQDNFGCEDILYPLSVTAFIIQIVIALFFAIISFIKKSSNQLLIKLYLISIVLVIIPLLIMIGGNLGIFN